LLRVRFQFFDTLPRELETVEGWRPIDRLVVIVCKEMNGSLQYRDAHNMPVFELYKLYEQIDDLRPKE